MNEMNNNVKNPAQDVVVLEAVPETNASSAVNHKSFGDRVRDNKKGLFISAGAIVATAAAYFGWKFWQKRKASQAREEFLEEVVEEVTNNKPEEKPEKKSKK